MSPEQARTTEIPEHLLPFVAEQDPSLYTPIDHASWRYIMRVSKRFFKEHAHQKYLDGLEETGISTERIPLISEMDECLKRFGWRAVAVVGFIPPALFLEFQSLGILVIACDMRRLEHLGYTPAPDIVHEAAGHAPIVADKEYRTYLRNYGEVARHAIFSKKDLDMYDAIRTLSDLKEDPKTTEDQIRSAQERFEKVSASISEASEASKLSRMAWWTVEYGLVGDMKNPSIYGAGLLSSVSESFHYLDKDVKKVPLSVACVEQGYDITKPQPQLYVTPDFSTLTRVLDEFANTMAFRKGGVEGLNKAKQAEATTTTRLDSGLQISSILADFMQNETGQPIYLQYSGPTQLAFKDQELEGQDPKHHVQGFGTPIGKIILPLNQKKSPAALTETDLSNLGFTSGKSSTLNFESGIQVNGVLKNTLIRQGKFLVLTFDSCTVTLGTITLFKPEWGTFDMACGETVVSVSGDAADRVAYLKATGGFKQKPASQKTNSLPKTKELEGLYQRLREIREKDQLKSRFSELSEIYSTLEKKYPDDWLLRLELLELDSKQGLGATWAENIRENLKRLASSSPDLNELISRGLDLLK